MSNEVKEIDLNLDLAFLPAWAQESPAINRYSNYEGEREDRRGGRSRGPWRDRPQADRPRGPRSSPGTGQGREDRHQRFRPGKPGKGGGHRGRPPIEKRPELPPLALDIQLVPEAKGVDSLTRQIRITGRAYPLFDVARLVLQKDDRFEIELRTKKPSDGGTAQQLFVCVLDDTPWLSEEEAVQHVLENHLATFYQVEKTPTDPPKGTYTFVAQCGMSGVLLGPPNYHDYQNKLHKLHQERFANMPFERFRSRVKIVRDEEVVKQWIEEQSFKTEYVVLNVPEPMKLATWEDVHKHFRAVHLPNIVKQVDRHQLPTAAARRSGSRLIQRHVAHEIDQQRRFPLKLVTALSQQFASRGLQFFKVNKSIVHVAVARPHFLDIETEPVSEGVKRIVQHVNAHPRCNVKDLVDALAPAAAPASDAAPDVPPPPSGEGEGVPSPEAERKPETHEPTAAQKAVLSDLHWLVHSGHVIEFANGELETAKKPAPKPAPAPKKQTPPLQDTKASGAAAPETTPTPAAEPVTETSPSEPSSASSGPVAVETGTPAPTESPSLDSAAQGQPLPPSAGTEPASPEVKDSGSPG